MSDWKNHKRANPILQSLSRNERYPILATSIVFSCIATVLLTAAVTSEFSRSFSFVPQSMLVLVVLVMLALAMLSLPSIFGILTALFTSNDMAGQKFELIKITPIDPAMIFDGYAAASIRRFGWLKLFPIMFWPAAVSYYYFSTSEFKQFGFVAGYEPLGIFINSVILGSAICLLYAVNIIIAGAVGVESAIASRRPLTAAWTAFHTMIFKIVASLGCLTLIGLIYGLPILSVVIDTVLNIALIWGFRRLAIRALNRTLSAA